MISELEQLVVELVNRARANPAAEAARLGIGLNDGLPAGTIGVAPLQPLAVTGALNGAADRHSAAMLAGNFFAHEGGDGSTATSRIFDAGWRQEPGSGWLLGENIAGRYATADVATVSVAQGHHDGLFRSPGHRINILEADFSELGVAQRFGPSSFQGTAYPNASLLTQNFADGGRTYITGVVIADADSDRFYDVGEGLGGVTVTVAGPGFSAAAQTEAAGGYAVAVPAQGVFTVSFRGGGLPGAIIATAEVRGANVKLDGVFDRAAADLAAARAEALAYVAGHDDLIAALAGPDAGAVAAAGAAHRAAHGSAEGRDLEGRPAFTADGYVGNYADLAAIFADDAEMAAHHFIFNGHREGRLRYDAMLYVASHDDLAAAFGADEAAGLRHWHAFGRAEARAVDFDAAQYLANYADLAAALGPGAVEAAARHYIAHGRAEGRSDIDPLDYVASHPDLIAAANAAVAAGGSVAAFGLAHYAAFGRAEGRTADFDAWRYLSAYPDLAAAFGRDVDAAAAHFVMWGAAEGRSDDLLG